MAVGRIPATRPPTGNSRVSGGHASAMLTRASTDPQIAAAWLPRVQRRKPRTVNNVCSGFALPALMSPALARPGSREIDSGWTRI
jgi:hypothetical protein